MFCKGRGGLLREGQTGVEISTDKLKAVVSNYTDRKLAVYHKNSLLLTGITHSDKNLRDKTKERGKQDNFYGVIQVIISKYYSVL